MKHLTSGVAPTLWASFSASFLLSKVIFVPYMFINPLLYFVQLSFFKVGYKFYFSCLLVSCHFLNFILLRKSLQRLKIVSVNVNCRIGLSSDGLRQNDGVLLKVRAGRYCALLLSHSYTSWILPAVGWYSRLALLACCSHIPHSVMLRPTQPDLGYSVLCFLSHTPRFVPLCVS